MSREIMRLLPKVEPDELMYIEDATAGFDEEELRTFARMYNSKRVEPQMILILSLIGLVAVAGIHRFVMGQIGMGILYILTAGFCGVGTIIDAINHKSMATEHNRKIMMETVHMIDRRA